MEQLTRDHASCPRGKRQHQPGFTLAEMLVTITILSILFMIAFPAMGTLILTQYVRAGASELHTALTFTRSEALKRGVNVEIVPANNDWRNGWSIQLGDGTVLRAKSELNTRLAAMAVAEGTKIVYRNDGRVTAVPNPIVFGVSSHAEVPARCVSVDLSGRPSAIVDTDNNAANGCN